ncbi:MAG TPA: hypothetical protein VF056_13035 [Thermoleophilaceae bacterium]
MHTQPRRKLTSAPAASDHPNPVDDVGVSGGELLGRIECLSAQLALDGQRLSAVERERDELLAANADLTMQLEGMWSQLRSADAQVADALADVPKGLLGRLGKRD